MYKTCQRCGRIHPANYTCNVGRKKRHYNYHYEESNLRNTTAWVYKAREMKARANYLCEVCRDEGVYNYGGLEVHHIVTLKEDPSKLLDDDNLITLCISHHKLADAGMIDKGYLRKLADAREKRQATL